MRATLWLGAGLGVMLGPAAAPAATDPSTVIATYADIAFAMYDDALNGARGLERAVGGLLDDPTPASLEAAREAWRAARVPYQQTEGLRFGNPAVDAWEGRVNAWPLDEGLIDYVAPSYGDASDENPLYRLNVIADREVRVGSEVIDAATIDIDLLRRLHEALEVEANVAQGYHAVEFLLWGQDLHGTGPGAGERPASDYSLDACTGGNCDRRRAYLEAATGLLVRDLEEMVAGWAPGGPVRAELAAGGPEAGLAAILTGLGSLSYGELAGERMKLGLLLHDPEEEHDCFADNTHNSHFYNQVGMMALWQGRYARVDGTTVEGPSIASLARERAAEPAREVEGLMRASWERLAAIKRAADSGEMAYDQMLGEGNARGNGLVQAGVDALVAQARGVETVVAGLGLEIEVEGSDSLDDPAVVAP